jgi:hypothetical protein
MNQQEVIIRIVHPQSRRRGQWFTRLAFKSTTTSILAIVAAYIVNAMAFPALEREHAEAAKNSSPVLRGLLELRPLLMFLPLPGLVLGVAAIVLRPLRPLLAPLALVASILAVAAIVGVLVAGLAPMYQMPTDLQLGK